MSHLGTQKRQKILNYEIRLIEECPDSLFNCSNCTHDRYLQWGLQKTIRTVIGNAPHRLRWMGSEAHSPLYAYIYIAITACSEQGSLMLQLKSALYSLAEKYLAVFEQKLLIEFLCLLEYSPEKHIFFRKYATIERIFVRLFSELEHRAPSQNCTPQIQENTFSKLTTCFTSPCRSQEDEQTTKEASLRFGKSRWVWLLEVYSRSFPFVRVEQVGAAAAKITVEVQRTSSSQEYYVCVEKECYFVVEVGERAVSKNSSRSNSIDLDGTCPCCLRSRNSHQQSPPSRKVSSSRNDFEQFTPKFISSKKKASLNGPDFYNDQTTGKKVNVEVLDLADFQENASAVAVSSSKNATLQYKKRIDNLSNINATIKSIDLEKPNHHPDFKSRPFHNQFANQRQILTEHAIPNRFSPQRDQRTQQAKPALFARKYGKASQQNYFKGHEKQTIQANPQDRRNIRSQQKEPRGNEEKGKRQTLLSAANLRKFVKFPANTPAPASGQVVRFHSHSPRGRPGELSPLKPRMALQHPTKFTYS